MEQQLIAIKIPSHHDNAFTPITELLPPPNPIFSKNLNGSSEKVNMRIDYCRQTIQSEEHLHRPKRQRQIDINESPTQDNKKNSKNNQTNDEAIPLTDEYDQERNIFRRYNNDGCSKRGNTKYLASIFVLFQTKKSIKLPQYKGMIKDDQLTFDSNFQSANLMAVYKVGQNNYDLILQNDVNTGGFTQWYNFKVVNKRHNFIAKFNIVNLYKSKSLYNIGMKPITYSQKSNKIKKIWRRRGFNIFYDKNDINYEDNCNKCYKTLSFQYDFTIENDTVQFAHAMPYDLNDLQKLLESVKNNPKITTKIIGSTIMGKQIPVLKIKSVNPVDTIEKKAIIIMARQHPGQIPGSYIIEQMINELAKHSTQVEFLLWRFDFYVIPMINMDGVYLGNYRSNFAGYDLNRCWLKCDQNKQPQVYAIKNYIKKLSKKQNIELILDLHGHSRKMGSFFYGNNFGRNTTLFPYIASKTNTNILFDECKFSNQKAAKASTARVVLGNIIKQTGNVYTYETSFYGNYKNNRTNAFSFNQEHYKELGKSLVLSMYRTYMEVYKEEKTLKESIYLKNIKKQLQDLKIDHKLEEDSESGSDSEAESIFEKERQQLEEYYKQNVEKTADLNQSKKSIQDDSVIFKSNRFPQYKLPVEKNNEQIKRKITKLLSRNGSQTEQNKSNIKQRLPSIYQNSEDKSKQQLGLDKSTQLPLRNGRTSKLKVYGETFQLKSRLQSSTNIEKPIEIQVSNKDKIKLLMLNNRSNQNPNPKKELIKSFNTISIHEYQKNDDPRLNQHSEMKFIRRNKYRNNSLTLKKASPIFGEHLIHDVVTINRVDVQKIQQHNIYYKNTIQQMEKGFKLPIL